MGNTIVAKRFKRGDEHVYRCIAGEHLLIGLRRAEARPLFSVSESAVCLWERMERWASEDELVDVLCDRYEVARTHALIDVREFLAQLELISAVTVSEDR